MRSPRTIFVAIYFSTANLFHRPPSSRTCLIAITAALSHRAQANRAAGLGLARAATILGQAIEPVATGAATLVTGHAQYIELADEIAEDDCTVAGHGDNHRTASAILNAALITGGGFFRVTPTAAR